MQFMLKFSFHCLYFTNTFILNGLAPKKGEKRRVRGKNKCKEVANLMESQKIKVRFYNNRALSKSFARHLGRIARNPRITPMRVKAWSNISGTALKHIFDSIKVQFWLRIITRDSLLVYS
jgi:hypothetical protein